MENQPMHPEKTFTSVVPNAPFFLWEDTYFYTDLKKKYNGTFILVSSNFRQYTDKK
jgi:hypothetical protein